MSPAAAEAAQTDVVAHAAAFTGSKVMPMTFSSALLAVLALVVDEFVVDHRQ
jgi:hypothetical protein